MCLRRYIVVDMAQCCETTEEAAHKMYIFNDWKVIKNLLNNKNDCQIVWNKLFEKLFLGEFKWLFN